MNTSKITALEGQFSIFDTAYNSALAKEFAQDLRSNAVRASQPAIEAVPSERRVIIKMSDYNRDGSARSAPPEGYVWSYKLKADGTPKLVAKNYRKGKEQAASPLKRVEDILTISEWLYTRKGKKYYLAFMLGINVALRVNELLELRFSDLYTPDGEIKAISQDLRDDSDRIRVYQTKNNRFRSVYLNPGCVEALRRCYGDRNMYSGGYIFPGYNGTHLSEDTLRKAIKQAAAACGIEGNFGTHTLRKTWGYFHYKKFRDVDYLRQALGQKDSSSTLHYIGITEENVKTSYMSICFTSAGVEDCSCRIE